MIWDNKKAQIMLAPIIVMVFLASFSLAGIAKPSDNTAHMVYDCSSNLKKCNERFITETIENCNAWYTYQPIEDLQCEITSENVENVNIISDEANHIKSPITELNYSVEVITKLSKVLAEVILSNPIESIDEITKKALAWDIEFLPDGSFLVTLKSGRILYYTGNHFKLLDDKIPVLHGVFTGLMGLAIHPDYEKNHFIYLYYSVNYAENHGRIKLVNNRISRFVFEGEKLSDEEIMLDNIPGNDHHDGGRLEIGPDGKLYATTGDAIKEEAQNISFLGGKILRINLDGSIPEDNPFNESYVFSYGHRNPQGLAWNPGTGDLYSAEHGNWRYDEVNLIKKGGNYGWPYYKCDEIISDDTIYKMIPENPIRCFKNWTLAPSGMVFVDDPASPWHGNLFVAGLRGRHLHRFEINDNKLVHDEIFYFSQSERKGIVHPRMRDVEYFNGSLWVLSDVLGIAKLTPR